ncbi:hypothetical protein GCM10009555_028850 [Acrocarpospora macrocephala]|uniref:Uncharacterized protein n=1 Tax=Acrocarpospora macrocephala TaxID=150177 RepID=A0A5M3WPF2_9ACTN|nr:hypothetical protein [Acrocarpospora macrocephala]GES11207.1 hypothetical protein Amac_048040 [Acrocarpospora macrocephala]
MMIVMYAAALAFAPIAVPVAGCDPSGCANTNTSGDTFNTGNSKNSGNYRTVSNNLNSGNFSTANGSTNTANSSLSLNNADGPQRIIVANRVVKRVIKHVVKRRR